MYIKVENCGDFEKEVAELLALEREEDEVLPPPYLFDRIIRNVEIQRGKRRMARLTGGLGMACSILILVSSCLYYFFPAQAMEGGRRLVETVTYLMEGSIRVEESFIPRNLFDAFEEEALGEFLRIRKTIPTSSFRFPAHVPPGYRVRAVELSPEEGALSLFFQGEGGSFAFSQKKEGPAGPLEEDSRRVFILGNPGHLGAGEQGGLRLCFRDWEGTCFLLEGDLGEDELVKVARSLYGKKPSP